MDKEQLKRLSEVIEYKDEIEMLFSRIEELEKQVKQENTEKRHWKKWCKKAEHRESTAKKALELLTKPGMFSVCSQSNQCEARRIATQALEQLSQPSETHKKTMGNEEDCQPSSNLDEFQHNAETGTSGDNDSLCKENNPLGNTSVTDPIADINNTDNIRVGEVVNCPTCGTPCRWVGVPDFIGSDEVVTVHLEPVTQEDGEYKNDTV